MNNEWEGRIRVYEGLTRFNERWMRDKRGINEDEWV